MSSIHVLKFGGTSLKDAPYIRQAVDIIKTRAENVQPVVVASAVAGVTDTLSILAEQASNNPETSIRSVEELQAFHQALFRELLPDETDDSFNEISALFEDLQTVVRNQRSRTESPKAWRDHLLSFGERASVRLLEAALQHHGIRARAWDAHHFIKTDQTFGEAQVYANETRKNIRNAIDFINGVPIITGFIGATKYHDITTLGRSGSDYTASLVADALEADHLEIWTDVDGVLTADPDIIPEAQPVEALNFDDIAELATHGVGVIHSKTIEPIRNRDISVQVRNSHNLQHPGTRIQQSITSNGNFRNVTVNGPFTYLQVDQRHAGTIETILEKVSKDKRLEYRHLNHNEPARFLLDQTLFETAKESIEYWCDQQNIDIEIRDGIYELKKFTHDLQKDDAVIEHIFRVLRAKNIRALSVRRDFNQRYITLLLPKEEAHVVAATINRTWVQDRPTLPVFIAGVGAVGGTLVEQMDTLDHPEFNISVIGRCNSKKVKWQDTPDQSHPKNWGNIIRQLKAYPSTSTVFVDATGSEEVAKLYPKLFASGIHVVTPSKLANTLDQFFYNQLREVAESTCALFRYETTVGAGLPLISTINHLQQAGDTITEISGVVSGTMTYLFDRLEDGTPFSKAIVEARDKGYAEPDPRDDLSGEDVARKFLTLAREIDWNIERGELQVQSLIPEELAFVDADTFLKRLPEFDDYWIKKLERARKNGATLRYVGRLADKEVTISVEEVSRKSPLGQLKGTDNFIRIHSKRYRESPIIIQGPGAGKEVTAAGILSDIIKVAKATL